MTQHVTAIYEAGVLKPLGPLNLQDREVVSLVIENARPKRTGMPGEQEPTLFEILDEVGLVGSVKGAPADLSTNPEYMKGFGKSG